MKKRISIIILVILSICVTNAQDTIRTITAGNWTKTLEKDVTYTLEPFGSNISIKEGETNLHSLVLPRTLTFSSEESVMINGIKWATRNVGAHGQFVANPEDFGGYYQWGRAGDGHEQPTSGTTTILSITDNPGHGNFILAEDEPWDWRIPQNNALWNANENNPIKTANDPCPNGWRIPTRNELQSLIYATTEWNNLNGVYGYYFVGDGELKLFLPAAGHRYTSDGSFDDVGSFGYYWSSTPNGTNAYGLTFGSGIFGKLNSFRTYGFSVRCVSE